MKALLLLPGVASAFAAFEWGSFLTGVAAVATVVASIGLGYLARRDKRQSDSSHDRVTITAAVLAAQQQHMDQLQEDSERYRTELIKVEKELSQVRDERRTLRHDLANMETKCRFAMETVGEQATTIAHLEAKIAELGG